ncbi:hypothetical protein CDD81_6370 [Ophiocordyceps australis]|uniref:Uncharacterized protein n=1 Tax=Ophiocordyceps australis TaxID=1399860 RepID=A0A2C5X9H3_9HYPO|nr:hypothetical protein CDD81_6370 [Ophiocordyceps australis]
MSATQPRSRLPFLRPSNPLIPPGPAKTMSITQTYYLAHKARAKLSREAAHSDHNLRLLVGHANLLDCLMLELSEAEEEQERWFNQSVRGANRPPQQRHIQWADRIIEEPDDEYDSEDSSDSDSDFDDDVQANAPSVKPVLSLVHQDEEDLEDDLEEDYAQLELVRTPSHISSPPELLVDHDSDSSDDEPMPPSPNQPSLSYHDKDPKTKHSQQDVLYQQNFYSSRRSSTGLVSTISVY